MESTPQESLLALAVLDQGQSNPTSAVSNELKNKEILIGKLFLAINTITIVLTFLPVLFDFPSIYRAEWFGVADLIRLAEPLVTLPLNLGIFILGISEPVIVERKSSNLILFLVAWFGFSAALYQQGAGYHSGAAMFKSVIRNVKDEVAVKVTDPVLNNLVVDAYNYARDTWEHAISHYMYACGGILLSFLYAFMFRKHGTLELSTPCIIIWALCILTYGIIVAAVAIQYPFGGILGFVLTIVYGLGMLGFYLYRKPGWNIPGRYIVIQHYIASYILALAIMIPWSAIYGIKGRNNGAGI